MLKANIKEDITNNARRAPIEGRVPTPEEILMEQERIDEILAENDAAKEIVALLNLDRSELRALLAV